MSASRPICDVHGRASQARKLPFAEIDFASGWVLFGKAMAETGQ
jgi:hypothetical protein